MAEAATRATLANSAHPDTRLLPEADVDDMQFFLEQTQLILPVLGFSFLQPVPKPDQLINAPEGEDISPVFEWSQGGAKATAREYKGEFIVLKGSTAHQDPKPSWTTYRQFREQLIQEKRLVLSEDGRFYVFQEDIAFNSPSAVAAVAYAGNLNGRLAWKVRGENKIYRDWQEARLHQAGLDNTQPT